MVSKVSKLRSYHQFVTNFITKDRHKSFKNNPEGYESIIIIYN